MYYTPACDDLFTCNKFSYRGLQGRLKAIRAEFADATHIKLNAKTAVLENEFRRLCTLWAVMKAEYMAKDEYMKDKWRRATEQEVKAEPINDIYNRAKARGFSPNEAKQLHDKYNNPKATARVRRAIEARLG